MANNLTVTGALAVTGASVLTGAVDFPGGALNTDLVTNFNADLLDSAHKSTDGTLAGNSDALIPTEKAVKTYADTNKVAMTGDQTVAGVKTFSSIPVLPASNPTTDNQAARKAYADGLDSANVKLTGVQTVAGAKTFSDGVKIGESGAVLKTKILSFSFAASATESVNHGLTYTAIRGIAAVAWKTGGGTSEGVIRCAVSTTQITMMINTAITGVGYAIIFYEP